MWPFNFRLLVLVLDCRHIECSFHLSKVTSALQCAVVIDQVVQYLTIEQSLLVPTCPYLCRALSDCLQLVSPMAYCQLRALLPLSVSLLKIPGESHEVVESIISSKP